MSQEIGSAWPRLDDKGRCCGRKPITYRRDAHYFCDRCHKAYSLLTLEQIENWAYRLVDGKFVHKGEQK